jgi:hypothetical protein
VNMVNGIGMKATIENKLGYILVYHETVQLSQTKFRVSTAKYSRKHQIVTLTFVRHDENEKKTYLDELHWPNGAGLDPASDTSSRHWQKGIRFLVCSSHD